MYVLKDGEDKYLIVYQYSRKFEIITDADFISDYKRATTFDTIDKAKETLEELKNSNTYDVTNVDIEDTLVLENKEKEYEIKLKNDIEKDVTEQLKAKWNGASEEEKKNIIKSSVSKKSCLDFLKLVGEYVNDKFINKSIEDMFNQSFKE